MKLNISV